MEVAKLKVVNGESKLRTSGDALQKIGRVMEQGEFREFFRKYFNDWDDVTCMIMFMKLYDYIDQCYERMGRELTSDQVVEIVRECIKNGEMRSVLSSQMTNFTKGLESAFSGNMIEKFIPVIEN